MKPLFAAILPLLLALAPAAGASPVPATGTYLTGLGAGTLGFVRDGTSNTVAVGEASRLSVCFDNAAGSIPLSSITDGTSNTIRFGETLFLTLQVGTSLPYQPIGNIQDGTSNTIFIGESAADERCFGGETEIVDIGNAIVDGTSNTVIVGEGSRFDVCFRGVRLGGIADGTSNTIQFGEVSQNPVCFEDVRVIAPTAAVVPEPGMLGLLGLGALGLAASRGRRRPRGQARGSSAFGACRCTAATMRAQSRSSASDPQACIDCLIESAMPSPAGPYFCTK